MGYTYTETTGLITNVIAHLAKTENATALTAKDYNVAGNKTRLEQRLTALTAANAEQERLKVALREATTLVEQLTGEGYMDASGMVDTIAGAYGKTTPAGKNVLKIRSDIRRGGNDTPPPIPPQ